MCSSHCRAASVPRELSCLQFQDTMQFFRCLTSLATFPLIPSATHILPAFFSWFGASNIHLRYGIQGSNLLQKEKNIFWGRCDSFANLFSQTATVCAHTVLLASKSAHVSSARRNEARQTSRGARTRILRSILRKERKQQNCRFTKGTKTPALTLRGILQIGKLQ